MELNESRHFYRSSGRVKGQRPSDISTTSVIYPDDHHYHDGQPAARLCTATTRRTASSLEFETVGLTGPDDAPHSPGRRYVHEPVVGASSLQAEAQGTRMSRALVGTATASTRCHVDAALMHNDDDGPRRRGGVRARPYDYAPYSMPPEHKAVREFTSTRRHPRPNPEPSSIVYGSTSNSSSSSGLRPETVSASDSSQMFCRRRPAGPPVRTYDILSNTPL
eukprot:PhM_4_TR7740/c0_g1_i2/m.49846